MTERETQLIKDISRIHNYLSTDGLYTLKWKENIKSRSFDSSSRNKGFSEESVLLRTQDSIKNA